MVKSKRNLFFIVLIFISAVVIFLKPDLTGMFQYEKPDSSEYSGDTIKLANWNLQIFGDSKAGKEELIEKYTSVIDDYDIIFIQEIRDSDGSSFDELCNKLVNYECKISSRAGRTSSKEQYGIIYKNNIEVINFKDFNPDAQDRWERPPVEVKFKIKDYEFTAYNIHVKPDDVKEELKNLENVVSDEGNVIILGDFNADCSYYNNEDEVEFNSWNWVINDEADTTVAQSSCAYDRIIMNNDGYQESVKYGIYSEGITKEISDHYLVWVEIKI